MEEIRLMDGIAVCFVVYGKAKRKALVDRLSFYFVIKLDEKATFRHDTGSLLTPKSAYRLTLEPLWE